MKLVICGILDNAVGAYNQPMFFRTKMEAQRAFMDACRSADSQFAKHSSDYFLMYLGTWEDNEARFDAVVPERLMSAVEALQALAS